MDVRTEARSNPDVSRLSIRNPTTGEILNGKFYFMANTGIQNLKDWKIADPGKLEPLQIAMLLLK